MQELSRLNLNKSLDLIEDYVRSAPTQHFDETLIGKRKQAESAIDHIRDLLSNPNTMGGCCSTGEKSQDHPKPPS